MFSFHLEILWSWDSNMLALACYCVSWTCPSQGKSRDDDKHISGVALLNYLKNI